VAPLAADDGHQFDLPVGVAAARQHDVAARAGDARGELGEHHWLLVRARETRLGGVAVVVQADGENLARRRRGGAQVVWLERRRAGVVRAGRPLGELIPPLVDRLRISLEPAVTGLGHINPARVAGQKGEAAGHVGDPHVGLLGSVRKWSSP
jgi:hypothetical protein